MSNDPAPTGASTPLSDQTDEMAEATRRQAERSQGDQVAVGPEVGLETDGPAVAGDLEGQLAVGARGE